ncbi:5'-nucleotidase [Mesorhizobium sp. M7A.F.Ca.US.006.01.1.1]|uniref:5'-nucleotidase n=1 Tax=Mesorhizobium sp. M7A.F.Ca.US.006.01.1.1 TaxID=2496707 RepID=UPI000FCA8CAA|nr:5'-nucleotidase [Mesorhizobium sp. M7A.F.Ca.US.006.01.1.1]RUZ72529.1 5'-nucleotidase [Mesorhizobium sp. M7A.F.Ca.US.006.01.1.1]
MEIAETSLTAEDDKENGDPGSTLRAKPLRIGISTRALFDLEEEHRVFENYGVKSYAAMQLEREDVILRKGAGFEVVERLLALNDPGAAPYVEVILLSQNSPDLSLRAFKSIDHYGLIVKTGSFTSGRSLAPFVPAWGIDLFLSNADTDVKGAVDGGAAAARLGLAPKDRAETPQGEVRVAFDGDAVVFGPESDAIYKEQGLEAFLAHETANASNPMAGGPFGNFLHKLSALRRVFLNEGNVSKVRIALVTARNAPAHERVIRTLRAWGTPADEAHFVGSREKAPILKALGAHIFFDDQEKHVLGATAVVPAGHVPGPHDPAAPVIPAG